MMNLVELGTAIWFEHETRIIVSKYLLHCSLYRRDLVAHCTEHIVQFPFQEWTDSSASMHSIIGGGKCKPYILAKKK